MNTYKAAIIGCGDESMHHADAYREAGIPVVAGAIAAELLRSLTKGEAY